MQSINDFVLCSMAEACNLEPAAVQQHTRLAEIGFDSLSAASLTCLLEAQYSLELQQSDIISLYEATRVSDVIELVRRLVPHTA